MSNYLRLGWASLSSSILFAFIGLAVGFGFIFLLNRRKFLEREHVFLNSSKIV